MFQMQRLYTVELYGNIGMNGKHVRICKEAAVPIVSYHPGRPTENHETPVMTAANPAGF
jgi:hypothetical protein